MADASEINELRKQAINAFYDEYKELIAAWRNLDTKAQGNITIAGIFIAGAFGYISKVNQQPAIYEKALFTLTISLLITSVILAVLVLEIRTIFSAPLGNFVSENVKNISEVTDESDFVEYSRRIFYFHVARWQSVNLELTLANKNKGERLRQAQRFLLAAILVAALLTIIKTFV